jgi:hypothetical protein
MAGAVQGRLVINRPSPMGIGIRLDLRAVGASQPALRHRCPLALQEVRWAALILMAPQAVQVSAMFRTLPAQPTTGRQRTHAHLV